jgi:uncharacterized repeat protein (TIGR01451 family)
MGMMRAYRKTLAVLAAGTLVMAFNAVALAGGAPTYDISVEKSASPEEVPASGGTVTYTIEVHNEGTGFFQGVVVEDDMDGCTLSEPTGDDGDEKLEEGETWTYTCTVEGVMPGDENTATVAACHDGSECDEQGAEATGFTSVVMGEEDAVATDPSTDTSASTGVGSPGEMTWLLLIVGIVLLVSMVGLRPARAASKR